MSHHLKPGQGVVAERSGEEDLVLLDQVEDLDVVVQDDGLLLDEGELDDAEQHFGHVVGVAADLELMTYELVTSIAIGNNNKTTRKLPTNQETLGFHLFCGSIVTCILHVQ